MQEHSLPNPFPIPTFRIKTEENFKQNILTDSDRRYAVQTLATMLMTHVQRPTLSDCDIVAKSLVAKYGFLTDNEGSGQVSQFFKWQYTVFISRAWNSVFNNGASYLLSDLRF